eukprot:m.271080 g.271080  ORF g.271080 m.271080 type:complete len:312 (+) comp40549_c0_seq5:3315-4250(+)
METNHFYSWFEHGFLAHTKELRRDPERPVILFFDGHYSHVCYELAVKASSNNVILICLPPNTTDKLQPLDVAVFSSLKRVWGGVMKDRKLENAGATIKKEDFPGLLMELWEKGGIKPENFVAGFRATGIYPLKNAVKSAALAPSMPFSQPCGESQEIDLPADGSSLSWGIRHHEAFTPITTKIISHFSGIIAKNKDAKKVCRGRVKTGKYGEAITEPEAMCRLQSQKRRQPRKPSEPRKKKRRQGKERPVVVDENMCMICLGDFADDTPAVQEMWIGCDNEACGRWFHCTCVGFESASDAGTLWHCPECRE